MGERVPCCVPFCKRTTDATRNGVHINEFICAEHWKLTNKTLRRRYTKHRNKLIPLEGKTYTALLAIWAELRKQAIERGAGI